MILIKNLNKTYKSGQSSIEALKNINLTINTGEIFGIIGLSGAGKSSLIRCINLLETPTSGEILIDDVDIAKLKGKALRNTRKRLGMIFQHFNLLMNSTVYENIAFPLKISGFQRNEIDERVSELLELVGLSDKKNIYPAQLSGGQKQRIGIARALANNPEIILSDEATSALDPTNTESILGLLKDINQKYGITIIVITHEMSVIKQLCDKVAVIEDGLIVEQGCVIELFSNPQTQTSKRFLKDMIAKVPESTLENNLPGSKTIRVSFIGENAKKPFISNMVKKFNIDANIISGTIESIQNEQLGNLVINISGDSCNITSAINYLIENNLEIEVINHGTI